MEIVSKTFTGILFFFSLSIFFLAHSFAEDNTAKETENPNQEISKPTVQPVEKKEETEIENYGPELKPLKKWAVFPFEVVDDKLKVAADEAWWKVREKITEKKRFQVASRQYLQQRDVYQPRKLLSPEDIKFLAQHLEAEIIITGFSEYRDFQLNAYIAQTGQLLWSKKVGFHPSLRANEQLINLSLRLITELIEKIPYQGTIIERDEKKPELFHVDLGINEDISIGDEISFLKIILPDSEKEKQKSESTLSYMQTIPLALGKVVSSKKNFVVVEIKKEDFDKIRGVTLAGYPKEKKLSAYEDKLAPELVPVLENEAGREHSHSKNTVVFGGVFSFLALLLLAF